tara:strand:+ start:215516 stop:216274 length:759 start_codon:yes stop_codon:yes gene_type:complete
MKTLKIATLIVLSLILGTACEKDKNEESAKGTLRFKTEMTSGQQGQKFNIGDTIQIGNYDFNLKKFKLYLSNISLIRADSTSLEIKDILLADVGDEITGQFSINIDPDQFTGVYLGFGLDTAQNNSIPESFEREHPLSSFNQMYWTMLKYRFAILEGRSNLVDSLGTSTDRLNAYHPGTDILYRTRSFPLDIKIEENGSKTIVLNIDLEKLFVGNDTIDLMMEPQTHSEQVDFHIATKFMDNLKYCAEISLL